MSKFIEPRLVVAVEWQPIETAPQDAVILGGYFFQGRWIYRLAKWNEYHRAFNQYPSYNKAHVTHWQPLPSPPEAS